MWGRGRLSRSSGMDSAKDCLLTLEEGGNNGERRVGGRQRYTELGPVGGW